MTLIFLFGAAVGGLVIDLLWRIKIVEKARDGFRLAVFGRLYRVIPD